MNERYIQSPFPRMEIEHMDNGLTPPVSLYSAKIVLSAFELLSTPSIRFRSKEQGISPYNGFDCSGFVIYVLNEAIKQYPDIEAPDKLRYANDFFDRYGTWIDPRNRLPGDLICFSRDGISVNHMGIYVGDDIKGNSHYIHSPGHNNSLVGIKTVVYTEIHPKIDNPRFHMSPVGYKRPLLVLPDLPNGETHGRQQFRLSIHDKGRILLPGNLG
jgi:NlpC/P60 family